MKIRSIIAFAVGIFLAMGAIGEIPRIFVGIAQHSTLGIENVLGTLLGVVILGFVAFRLIRYSMRHWHEKRVQHEDL